MPRRRGVGGVRVAQVPSARSDIGLHRGGRGRDPRRGNHPHGDISPNREWPLATPGAPASVGGPKKLKTKASTCSPVLPEGRRPASRPRAVFPHVRPCSRTTFVGGAGPNRGGGGSGVRTSRSPRRGSRRTVPERRAPQQGRPPSGRATSFGLRLPEPEDGSVRIGDDAERAHVRNFRDGLNDLAAELLGLLRGAFQVVDLDIGQPVKREPPAPDSS